MEFSVHRPSPPNTYSYVREENSGSTRKIVQKLGGHTGTVTQVSMGDGNFMASGSNDKTIIIS